MDGEQRHSRGRATSSRRSWARLVACWGRLVAAPTGLEGLRGDLGVEAEAWSWSVAELDRTELCGVFVDPGAGEPEVPGELLGGEEPG